MLKATSILCGGLFLMLALPSVAAVSDENAGTDATTTRTFQRNTEAHYGTQTVTGGYSESNDFLYMTDHINDGLRAGILADPTVDARVKNNLGAWVDPAPSNIEWVVGTPEGLDAAGNLYNDLTNISGRTIVSLSVGPSVLQGTRNYLLDSFVSNEVGPVVVGDPDSPVVFGSDGQSVQVTNNFEANVSYYERNSTVCVSPLVLDLDGDGKLEASNGQWLPHPMTKESTARRAVFDFYGNGFPVELEWVGANDGLLVMPKADGSIDGTCLFGTATGFDSGFHQLATLDKNGDFKISGQELEGLAVWQDKNGDAVAVASEVTPVQTMGVKEIGLKHTKMVGSVTINGKQMKMWDWWPNGFDLRKRQVNQSR
ncbi:hypothetical protein DYH09_29985 [bacterium CPR1]|nr:hypothetical protein [bacterium CPR1]